MIDIKHKVCSAAIASTLALLIAGGAVAQDAQPDLANALKNKGARLQSLQRGRAVSAPANAKLLVEGQKSFAAGDGPNDPVFKAGLNWHYKPLPAGMNAVGAWAKTTGAKDVVVAVLSTGILPKHPDIAGSPNLLPGHSFVSQNGEKRKADATDPGQDCSEQVKASYEGTLTAGLIGAVKTNNGVAIAGLNSKRFGASRPRRLEMLGRHPRPLSSHSLGGWLRNRRRSRQPASRQCHHDRSAGARGMRARQIRRYD